MTSNHVKGTKPLRNQNSRYCPICDRYTEQLATPVEGVRGRLCMACGHLWTLQQSEAALARRAQETRHE